MIGLMSLEYDLHVPHGGAQTLNFLLKQADGITPYPITGKTFEYVARNTPTSTGTPQLIVTQTLSADGQLVVDVPSGKVTLNLAPAATDTLNPGTYYHALWMDPGLTTAFIWFEGTLFIDPVAHS